jgi:toxin ParE1/3/4
MMNVAWSPQARSHLAAIFEYFAERNLSAGRDISDRIEARVGLLTERPYAGRPGQVPGTRELVVLSTPYVVAYRVRKATGRIEIAAVRRGARRRPDSLE